MNYSYKSIYAKRFIRRFLLVELFLGLIKKKRYKKKRIMRICLLLTYKANSRCSLIYQETFFFSCLLKTTRSVRIYQSDKYQLD